MESRNVQAYISNVHGGTLSRGEHLTGGIVFQDKAARCNVNTKGLNMQPPLQRTLDSAPYPLHAHEMSDEELMTLLVTGDSKALEILFGRHSKLVFSIALRVLRDAGEAEEIVQECFLYIYRKAPAFEPSKGSAKVWIVQVAYSRARDRKAHLSRRGYYVHKDIESPELEDTIARLENAENAIEARLDFGRLQCAFDDLTAVQRQTLELYYFEEMGLKEISQRLHEPFGNVRHHFYRGLERLRKSSVVQSARNQHNGKEKSQGRS